MVKSLSDTQPDLGCARGPDDVHWNVDGSEQVPLLLVLEELLELEELLDEELELPLSHPPELLEDELEPELELELPLEPPSQPNAIKHRPKRIIAAERIYLFCIYISFIIISASPSN